MKLPLTFSLLLCCCLSVCAQQVSPRPRPLAIKERAKKFRNSKRFFIEYDKFKDQTLVSAGPFGISGTARYMAGGGFISLSASFLFPGQSITQPVSEFFLMLHHSGNDWQFLTTKEIDLLIDGERITLPALQEGEVNSRRGIGSMGVTRETLATTLTPEMFRKLGTAKSVEMRAGSYQTKLKDEHQEAFRDLLSLSLGP